MNILCLLIVLYCQIGVMSKCRTGEQGSLRRKTNRHKDGTKEKTLQNKPTNRQQILAKQANKPTNGQQILQNKPTHQLMGKKPCKTSQQMGNKGKLISHENQIKGVTISVRGSEENPYLIFVIFFTESKFLENKIYTQKTRKLRQNTQ